MDMRLDVSPMKCDGDILCTSKCCKSGHDEGTGWADALGSQWNLSPPLPPGALFSEAEERSPPRSSVGRIQTAPAACPHTSSRRSDW